ncbi:MAG: FecR domain-containing protein [Tannerella sp.]|jgi:ferric-dicitrate binding protein FerR (iron transport regulator)|nr:FecR domain-containing protein [Tannerella sp.]
MIRKTDKLIFTTRHPSGKYTVENSYGRLQERIDEYGKYRNGRWSLRRKITVAAASAAILALCSALFLRPSGKENIHVLSTGNEKQQFILPDSTCVWLNVNSRLTYADAFGRDGRDVELSGEAYFEVTEDAAKPFTVKAGEVSVRVLGTVFNVQAYPSEEMIETTLLKGSVGVMHKFVPQGGIILCSGQQALYDKAAENIVIHQIDCSPYTSWKDGKLIFSRTTLKDAFAIMERNLRIRIVVNSKSLEERKITGRFDLTEKPENILNVIRETLPFEYENRNDTLFIIK